MKGAAKRQESARAMAWTTAMLPHTKKPVGYEEFVFGKRASSEDVVGRWVSAWDKVDRALAANGNAKKAG